MLSSDSIDISGFTLWSQQTSYIDTLQDIRWVFVWCEQTMTINAYHFMDKYSIAHEMKIMLTYEMAN